MKFRMSCLLVCLLLWRPAAAGSTSTAGADELAGEQEAAKTPEARVEAAEPDEKLQMSLTRSGSGAAPSFVLPEAVVTGSGEHKALSRRPELSVMLDTSGGIKANPSEQDASKNQLGAVGLRQSFESLTQSSRPAYGELRALYGWDNTFEGGAFWGQELKDSYYLLEGDHDFSDGGPSPIPVQAINQSSDSGLLARGGYRQGSGAQWSGELSGRWRDRFWTLSPLEDPRLSRSIYDASLVYQGAPDDSFKPTIKLKGSQAEAIVPGEGTAYSEGILGLSVDLEKEFLTRESRTLLSASLYARKLDQDHGARSAWLAGGWLMARLEPWAGASLGLGLSLDSLSDEGDGLLVAPRAEFEQRLGAGLSAWARFAPKMELPTLEDSLFEKDPAYPSIGSLASKDSVNLEGGLSAAVKGNIGLELKGFVRQNEDASELDDPSGSGLWRVANVRGSKLEGGEFSESSPLLPGLSQQASLRYEDWQLLDSPGLSATFAPAWKAQAGGSWAQGPWKAGLSAAYVGQRQAHLSGGDSLPAYVDLRLNAAYAFNASLSLLAEARNILAQPVEEFPGYVDPSPFVGLGAAYQF